MKVVINRCYGGFGLSPRAVARIAEVQGRACFFYTGLTEKHPAAGWQDVGSELFWQAYDVPIETLPSQARWSEMSQADRIASNRAYEDHGFDFDDKRTDPVLVQVVEELGEASSGRYADLQVVTIPDGTEYTIEEYDGLEHVAEAHETWR